MISYEKKNYFVILVQLEISVQLIMMIYFEFIFFSQIVDLNSYWDKFYDCIIFVLCLVFFGRINIFGGKIIDVF